MSLGKNRSGLLATPEGNAPTEQLEITPGPLYFTGRCSMEAVREPPVARCAQKSLVWRMRFAFTVPSIGSLQ